jgi:lipopolysaccharide export system permease protein
MSPILNRYLIREIASAMFATALLLMVVVFCGLLTDVLSKITQGRFPPQLILTQMALRIPMALSLLLPLAGFIGVILAYTRLYRDSELAVLRASGFSELGLLRPVFNFALPLALVISGISLYLAPTAQRIAIDQAELANRQVAIAGLEAGSFVQLKSSNAVIFAGELVANKGFRDVLIVRTMPVDAAGHDQLQIVRARSGMVGTAKKNAPTILRLSQGQRTDIVLGQNNIERAAFKQADLVLPESLQQGRGYLTEDLPTQTLLISLAGRAELQVRIGGPIMLILLMLLAPALARSAPRQVRYDRIVIGVLLYLVYSQAIELAKKAMVMGKTPEWLGLWWVHGVFVLALLVVYRAQLVLAWRARAEIAALAQVKPKAAA